uniref:hypothetical protein n=1 Tax=Pseudomonas viridiflava TaxID=33069 RepID=UPI0019800509
GNLHPGKPRDTETAPARHARGSVDIADFVMANGEAGFNAPRQPWNSLKVTDMNNRQPLMLFHY